jgi:hypothetical protein
MTSLLVLLAVGTATPTPGAAPASDTLHLEVGSPEVDALYFVPHRARNSVYIGDATTPSVTWTNELTVGDSAGLRVHRWVTKGTQANGTTWELHQTYNGRTLAPLKWAQRSSAGADSRLEIDGTRVRGVLKGPGEAPANPIDRTIPRAGFVASASDLVPMAVGLRAGLVMTAPIWSPQSTTVESRVFTVLRQESVKVEGVDVMAWRVEERVHATGELKATWWLIDVSPYMVLAEIPLSNGQTQRITGVALD